LSILPINSLMDYLRQNITRPVRLTDEGGYSLIELVVVLIIIGILATVAMRSLTAVNNTVRAEDTKSELQNIAYAIAGNPELTSGGARTDYGYVGDIGALPPDLDALVSNPGGYATWRGPYLRDAFSSTAGDTYYKVDAWGGSYTYSGGITIASNGGGTPLTRRIANSTDDLLRNSAALVVTDVDNTPPGTSYQDSVRLVLHYPDGGGGLTTRTTGLRPDGSAEFDSIPIGVHTLDMIYLPTADTLRRRIAISPGKDYYAHLQLHEDLWSGGGGGSGPSPISEPLFPSSPGSSSSLWDYPGSGGNWTATSETTADGDVSYVRGNGNPWRLDTYSAGNHSAGTGAIDSVRIVITCRAVGSSEQVRTAVVIGGSVYYGTAISITNYSYAEYSTAYSTNPATGSAWTWSAVDNMEIGVSIRRTARCTQVRAEVYYAN